MRRLFVAKVRNTTLSIAFALVMALVFAALLPAQAHAEVKNEYPSFDAAVQAFISDSRWAPGTPWGDDQPSILDSVEYTTSYWACAGYAVDFGLFVYGSNPFEDWELYYDPSEIRAGDNIRIELSHGPHSFVVIDRNGSQLTTLEGNFNAQVHLADDHYTVEGNTLYSFGSPVKVLWGSHPLDIYSGYDINRATISFDSQLDWLSEEGMSTIDYYLQENECPTEVSYGTQPLEEGVDYQFGGFKLAASEVTQQDGSSYLGAYGLVRIIGLGQFSGTVALKYQGIVMMEGNPPLPLDYVVEDPDDHGTVKRLKGDSALDTMNAIIDAGAFAKGGTVVLASLEGYWDALTAAGIAGLEDAPVVMTTQDALPAQAKAQITKLAPSRIIVCGGTYWIPDKVVKQAADAAGTKPTTVRLAGNNAAITATKIYEEGKKGSGWSDTAIIATAGTFQDALAAAPIAYANAMPIFLASFDFATEKGSLSSETLAALKAGGFKKVYLAGGTYWIPDSVKSQLSGIGITDVKRLSGATAVETSSALAAEAIAQYGMTADNVGIATVASHYDALAGAAFCGKANSVMVLVNDEQSSSITRFLWDNHSTIDKAYVFGGTSTVDPPTYQVIGDVVW